MQKRRVGDSFEIHVVMGAGVVLGAYTHYLHAQLHAKAILGARVVSVDVHDDLPPWVHDDLATDMEWNDDDADTPVVHVSYDPPKDE